jgi:indole-3-glycerol phosphate synthase
MINVLQEICTKKAEHVAAMKAKHTLDDLKARIANQDPARGFGAALSARTSSGAPALIAEVKKASPSKGLIRADFDPAAIAKIYAQNGAACISTLTDTPYFQGTDDHFNAVRAAVDTPLLRKDFMVDTYQIFESRAMGADCILIIMAALSDDLARELYDTATALGVDALFEIHDEAELHRALALDPKILGVNSRNLKTLAVDVQTAHDLAAQIPNGIIKVAESGIDSNATLCELQNSGYGAFLVGESLMRQDDIKAAVHALLGTSA